MDTDLAILKEKVATLTALVEGLVARPPQSMPMPPQIAYVNSAGRFMDWDGSNYQPDTNISTITPKFPGGSVVMWRQQSQRWELIAPAANLQRVTFITSMALTTQAVLDDCSVVMDWFGNTGGVTTIDAVNEMGWTADAGVEGYADWRPADSKWIIMLIPCPAGNS